MAKNDIPFRTAYGEKLRVDLDCGTESMTQQSFAAECDINNIMAKWEKTGVLTHVRSSEPFYGDFLETFDYHSAVNAVHQANDFFMSLPATVRARFQNDAGAFLEFLKDPANKEELISMGLAQATETPSVSSTSEPVEGSE